MLEQFHFWLEDCISVSQIRTTEGSIFEKKLYVQDKHTIQCLMNDARNDLNDLFEKNL